MKTSVWEGVTALVLVFGLFGVFVVRAATFIRLNEAVTRPFEGPETFRISAFDYWFQFTKVVWLLGSLLMLLVGFLSGHWLRGLMGYAVWLAFMACLLYTSPSPRD